MTDQQQTEKANTGSHVEIIGDPGRTFTDTPRALTDDEAAKVKSAYSAGGRVKAIPIYREMTDATLAAAIREVDALCGAKAASHV